MHDFLIALDLRGRDCLVVGGGRVAATKVADLATAGAAVTVVAPEVSREASPPGVTVLRRRFGPADLDGRVLVFAATDDVGLNAEVAAACRQRGVPCCNAGDPAAGDFTTPAQVGRGPVAVAVSTGGAAPALAKRLREDLDAWLPRDLAAYAAFLEEARAETRRRVPDAAGRRRVATRLASAAGYAQWRGGDEAARAAWLDAEIASALEGGA